LQQTFQAASLLNDGSRMVHECSSCGYGLIAAAQYTTPWANHQTPLMRLLRSGQES
jgi:hypothetical protein